MILQTDNFVNFIQLNPVFWHGALFVRKKNKQLEINEKTLQNLSSIYTLFSINVSSNSIILNGEGGEGGGVGSKCL